MDPTLDAEGHDYFGVTFNDEILAEELLRNKVYGLLDLGVGLNSDLMFGIDPRLLSVCQAIKRK